MYGNRTDSLPTDKNGAPTYGVLFVAKASQYCAQLYIPNYNIQIGSSTTEATRLFIRSYADNRWSSWTPLKVLF